MPGLAQIYLSCSSAAGIVFFSHTEKTVSSLTTITNANSWHMYRPSPNHDAIEIIQTNSPPLSRVRCQGVDIALRQCVASYARAVPVHLNKVLFLVRIYYGDSVLVSDYMHRVANAKAACVH